MKIGYVRVSTIEQNEARQMEALRKFIWTRSPARISIVLNIRR